MNTEQSDSFVKKALRSFCCDNGWSYGVFWGFDQRNSLLLTVQETYYDEQMGAVIDDMLLQVQMLGGGVIGQTAFTKKHRWIVSDAHSVGQIFMESIGRCDVSQDDSEFYYQFTSGIKTIALIPVEPQGVLQLGSTQKIPENEEFVNHTKGAFREMGSCHGLNLSENSPSSSKFESYFASLLSSGTVNLEDTKFQQGDVCQSLVGPTFFPVNPLIRQLPNCDDHYWHNTGTESQVMMSSDSNTQLLPLCSSTWSGGESTLMSFKHQASESRSQASHDVLHVKPERVLSCENSVQHFQDCASTSFNNTQCISGRLMKQQHSTLSFHETESELLEGQNSLPTFSEMFELGNYTADHIKACSVDSFYPWFDPSLDQSNNADVMNDDLLSEAMKFVSPPYNSGYGDSHRTISVNHPSSSVHSSITSTSSIGKQKCSDVFKVEHDLFDHFGGNIDDILKPVTICGQLDINSKPECISWQHDGSTYGHRKGLFSKLGIEQLIEGVSGTSSSVTRTTFEDQLSPTAKRKRTGSSLESMDQFHLAGSSFHKKEDITKLDSCSWVTDSYKMTAGRTELEQKKHATTAKTMKKKAKPGTRPRPKDRQMIQDRLSELRELVPNGEKMSIDCLLDRTIKYMLFLQRVTKHAETLKEADETKENEIVKKNNFSSSGNGATWACELGDQSMICPLLVEDLSRPGQMLIEMLCEEQGFFLEKVNIIRGFGLTILKGVMEVRENKIWARFIVESEGNRRVSRHEIFSTLIQLLQLTASSGVNASEQIGNVIDGGTTLVNNYPSQPYPQFVVQGQLR